MNLHVRPRVKSFLEGQFFKIFSKIISKTRIHHFWKEKYLLPGRIFSVHNCLLLFLYNCKMLWKLFHTSLFFCFSYINT